MVAKWINTHCRENLHESCRSSGCSCDCHRPPVKNRDSYLSAPDHFILEQEMQFINRAFDNPIGSFLVGSATQGEAFRDVDIRMIMSDEQYNRTFTADLEARVSQLDPLWILLSTSISLYLSKKTGLPIDFQFQSMWHANHVYPNLKRVPIGLALMRQEVGL